MFKKLTYIDHVDEFNGYRTHTSTVFLLLICINKTTGFWQEFKIQKNNKWIATPFFHTFLRQWRVKNQSEVWLCFCSNDQFLYFSFISRVFSCEPYSMKNKHSYIVFSDYTYLYKKRSDEIFSKFNIKYLILC